MKNWQKIFFYVKQEFKSLTFQIKNKSLNIPSFNNILNILFIVFISYTFFMVFNITQSQNFDDLRVNIMKNISFFTLYLMIEIILLLLSIPIFKKLTPIKSILYLFFTVTLTNYLGYAITHEHIYINSSDYQRLFLSLLSSLSLTFAFILYFDWRIRSNNPIDNIAKINLLQSKMDPHFLFNALNTTLYLIKTEPNTAQKIITNLSDLFRAVLHQKQLVEIIPLKQELLLIDKYLEIEKIRLEERLIVEKDIDANTLDYLIPQFLIQPLVENCVYHGAQSLLTPHPIYIRISTDLMNRLIIEIKNTYEGSKDEFKKHSNKISLKNLKERIDLYYNGRGEIKTIEDKNTFYVYIKVPSRPISF